MKIRRRNVVRTRRSGVVAVEFALTAPIAFLLVTTSIEFGRVNSLRNTAENAAYEGARESTLPGATEKQVKRKAREALKALGVKGGKVTVTPSNFDSSTDKVKVTVTIPLNKNAWITPFFSRGKKIVKSCELSREKTTE